MQQQCNCQGKKSAPQQVHIHGPSCGRAEGGPFAKCFHIFGTPLLTILLSEPLTETRKRESPLPDTTTETPSEMATQDEKIKWVEGSPFMVDGFRFANPRCKHYLLTHFHSGLNPFCRIRIVLLNTSLTAVDAIARVHHPQRWSLLAVRYVATKGRVSESSRTGCVLSLI